MEIPRGLGRFRNEIVYPDNLGQNIADKVTKLSKIGFSMEHFTADFTIYNLQNFTII